MLIKKFITANSKSLTFTWALIIFLLCATPGQYIPTTNWLELLSFDKWVHASMFFILTSLCFVSITKYNHKKFLFYLLFFFCVAYGGLLEIMQANCFSNRSADIYDFIANSFGCFIALVFLKKTKTNFQ